MNGDGPIISKPKPMKQLKERKRMGKAALERKLDRLNRELVFWLYPECVEKATDGKNCGGEWELGHIIRRADSAWLKRLWWNLCKQCFLHNHYHGDPQLQTAMGEEYMARLRVEYMAHRGEKEPGVEELRRRIAKVEELLEKRPTSYGPGDLKRLGYYGP